MIPVRVTTRQQLAGGIEVELSVETIEVESPDDAEQAGRNTYGILAAFERGLKQAAAEEV